MKKLSLSLIIIIVCAVFALGWVIDQMFENYAEDSSKDIISHYQTLGQQLASVANHSDRHGALVTNWNSNDSNKISIVSKQQFPLPAELQSDFFSGKPLVLNNGNALTFHYYLSNKELVLTFSPDELVINSNQSELSLILTALFYLGIVAIVAIWLFPLVNRLNRLTKTAIQFGSGELSKRVAESKTSYISDLEIEFNRMAEKIETLIADNKLISSAVSHDLKTPLARLRLGLDVITDNNDHQVQQKYISRLSKDIDEMQTLITVLIDYARLEQALIKIARKPVDLEQLLEQIKLDYFENGFELDLKTKVSRTLIAGDLNYLTMLFQNLLENGFRYCKDSVLIELVENTDKLIVRVHDDGNGIEKSLKKDILKPFIKQDSSGHGLGLAIVERIAHWHQAELAIADSEILGGAMFEVTFAQST